MNLYDDRYDIYSYIGKVQQIKGEGIKRDLYFILHIFLILGLWKILFILLHIF